jgi:hypothetical protein
MALLMRLNSLCPSLESAMSWRVSVSLNKILVLLSQIVYAVVEDDKAPVTPGLDEPAGRLSVGFGTGKGVIVSIHDEDGRSEGSFRPGRR